MHASHDEAHHKQVLKALENGKHVYVEKPLCLKKKTKEIRDKLKSNSNLRISSNMVLRTCPLFVKVRENVKKMPWEKYIILKLIIYGEEKKS